MDLINLCDFLNRKTMRATMRDDLTSLVRASVDRLERRESDEGE